jgi:hypothetical protein
MTRIQGAEGEEERVKKGLSKRKALEKAEKIQVRLWMNNIIQFTSLISESSISTLEELAVVVSNLFTHSHLIQFLKVYMC